MISGWRDRLAVFTYGALAVCALRDGYAQTRQSLGGTVPPATGMYRAMFGGDAQHTGRTDRHGPHGLQVTQGALGAPGIAWRVRTSRRVFGSPVVTREGLSVVGSLDGGVHALDRSGVERWAYRAPGRVFSSPAEVGDRTVLGHDGGAYFALGPRGLGIWTFPTTEDADAPPVVGVDGTVFVASSVASALGPEGRARWSTPLGGHAFGAPAITLDGATLVVTELSGALVFLRTGDGRVLRRVQLPAAVRGGVLVLSDGAVVVGADDGHIRCIGPDGVTRWDTPTVGAAQRLGVRATPALGRDGTVIVGADDGGIYGIRPTDGGVVFRVATGGPVRSSARIDADGWVYAGSEDDRVWALRPDGSPAWSVILGADVDGSPAIPADGLLVVGCDDGGVYGIGELPHRTAGEP